MKASILSALISFIISVIIFLGFYFTGTSDLILKSSIFINVFLLMSSIAVGVFLTRKAIGFNQATFIDDIKSSMQSGIVFTILLSLFVYVYFDWIDPEIVASHKQNWINGQYELVPDEEAYKKLQTESKLREDKTYMDYRDQVADQADMVFSPKFLSFAYLIAGMLLSVILSIIITIILRQIVLRGL